MATRNPVRTASDRLNEKQSLGLIRSYTGPESLRLPVARILREVQRLYAPEDVDPGVYDIRVEANCKNKELGVDIEGSYVEGGYDVTNGMYIVHLNPFDFDIPTKLGATGTEHRRDRFCDIARPVAKAYLGTTLATSMEALFKKDFPDWYEGLQQYPEVFSPLDKFLIYLQHVRKTIVDGQQESEIVNDPQFVQMVLRLSQRYVRDREIRRYKLVPANVHETSHKMMIEQTPYGDFRRRMCGEKAIWEVAYSERKKLFLDSNLGKELKTAYLDMDKERVERLCREMIRRKAQAIGRRLGADKREDYETYTKARGLDENLARAITHKLTGIEEGHDSFTTFYYMVNDIDVGGGSLERLQEFLRDYKYRDVLEMELEDFVKKFSSK